MKKRKQGQSVSGKSKVDLNGGYQRATFTIPRSITPEHVRTAMHADLQRAVGSSDEALREIEKIISCYDFVYGDFEKGGK